MVTSSLTAQLAQASAAARERARIPRRAIDRRISRRSCGAPYFPPTKGPAYTGCFSSWKIGALTPDPGAHDQEDPRHARHALGRPSGRVLRVQPVRRRVGRPGSVCVTSSSWDARSECRWSCSADSDCVGSVPEQCTDGTPSAPHQRRNCRADSDVPSDGERQELVRDVRQSFEDVLLTRHDAS